MIHAMNHSSDERKGFPTPGRNPDAGRFLELWHAILEHLWRRHNQVKKSYDLSPPQLGLLYHLNALGPIHLSKLLWRMPGHLSSLTQVVNRMEENGWVVRKRDVKDRRRVIIEVTPKARKVLKKIEPFGIPLAVIKFLNMKPEGRRKAFASVKMLAELFGADLSGVPEWEPGKGPEPKKSRGGS
jgi:DNA-binding MarR family transcriptional regulator